ncbi:hypothetical protein QA640_37955 [Bradyrhizobium sp. CB82]|uniref:hypothetical protein n=1 Tax=Bradyrhizobium sp. CB82 TaxID=3039159 RepID=UPI0024B0FF1C|nr:hypothetical protein [Bradyrhizobium sp. CB82]WFU39990.1 hypothetical protein QA640_37955 [Bradyrhizobium sp. CB82]
MRNDKDETTKVALEIKFKRIAVLPPIGKQKRYPALDLPIIHATERGTPKGRKPIEWKLITDLVVRSRSEAIEKINWYAMRWKIELFHKILKSGCKAEDSKLRTVERLAQSNGGLLHSQFARPLAHHAQSHRLRRVTEARIDVHQDRIARSTHQRREPSTMSPWNPCVLSYQSFTIGWLPGQGGRSAAWKCCHLARPLETHRYRTRRRNRNCWKCE